MLLLVRLFQKIKLKLVIAKIRDVTSYGMLCSESELNLSDESEGITEFHLRKTTIVLEKVFFSI